MGNEIYVAATTGVVTVGGRRYRLRKGTTRVRAGHPLMQGREHMFRPLDVHYDNTPSGVEQATAAPGERSSTVRPEKTELLARAEALGVEVDRRLGVDKLRALIAEAEVEAGPVEAEVEGGTEV